MDSKNKKEEKVSSRREFFKSATKKALPILAAVVLSLPLIAKAAETTETHTSCENSCYQGCTKGCGSDCKGYCKGTCEKSCEGKCYGCKGGCTGTCTGTCKFGCKGKNQYDT
jgi:CXXX repeat radical SAM target protein